MRGRGGGLLTAKPHTKPMPVLKGQNGRVGGNETLNETGRRAGGRSESMGVLYVLQLAPEVPVKKQGRGAPHCCPGPPAAGWKPLSDCLFMQGSLVMIVRCRTTQVPFAVPDTDAVVFTRLTAKI